VKDGAKKRKTMRRGRVKRERKRAERIEEMERIME
jgi:hypothetical protein